MDYYYYIYKLVTYTLPEDWYPKQLFNQKWNVQLRRGRQRKVWSSVMDNIIICKFL